MKRERHSLMSISAQLLLLVLFLGTVITVRSDSSLEEDLKGTLYRKCWKECERLHSNNTSEHAVLSLINDQFDLDKHELHCSAYNATKDCAFACLTSPHHEYYLRPFVRRNYLNDFICVKHYQEFRRYLPCYRHQQSLEFFFIKCGYFAIDAHSTLQATTETCESLRCVTRYIPGLIRQEHCSTANGSDLSKGAGDLMERMVTAFLRERVKLNKMKRLCEDTLAF